MPAKKDIKKNNKNSKTNIPKKYKKIIDALENDLLDVKNKNVRLLAEFDNYKKRNDQEKSNLIKYEGMSIIKPILSVLDDLDRTLKIPTLKKNKAVHKGIEMIFEKISSSLSDLGVKSFNSLKKDSCAWKKPNFL